MINVGPQTQKDYILQFVDRIDSLLEALLSREDLPKEHSTCSHCSGNLWAVWRCQDCSLATPMCRKCMRNTHQENPFHRVQCWTGTHFRAAELWEVGTYILVPHYAGQRLCDTLTFQKEHLEEFEQQKDRAEQVKLTSLFVSGPTPRSAAPSGSAYGLDEDPVIEGVGDDAEMCNELDDELDDEAFEKYLDDLHQQVDDNEATDGTTFFTEADDTAPVSHADDDIVGFPPYLPDKFTFGTDNEYQQIPKADAFNNGYVRIVHTNGIHHLAMVSCPCRGAELLPVDLVACRLLPASFVNIRTLFSAQLLDLFRLCNLELKASVYQFYQLLRRLTMPLAPAGVVDLYNEFRRMSRLWRWMKKLKWAGVGHSGKTAMDVKRGELANYCPACPQPHINLPEKWKDDPNR